MNARRGFRITMKFVRNYGILRVDGYRFIKPAVWKGEGPASDNAG